MVKLFDALMDFIGVASEAITELITKLWGGKEVNNAS